MVFGTMLCGSDDENGMVADKSNTEESEGGGCLSIIVEDEEVSASLMAANNAVAAVKKRRAHATDNDVAIQQQQRQSKPTWSTSGSMTDINDDIREASHSTAPSVDVKTNGTTVSNSDEIGTPLSFSTKQPQQKTQSALVSMALTPIRELLTCGQFFTCQDPSLDAVRQEENLLSCNTLHHEMAIVEDFITCADIGNAQQPTVATTTIEETVNVDDNGNDTSAVYLNSYIKSKNRNNSNITKDREQQEPPTNRLLYDRILAQRQNAERESADGMSLLNHDFDTTYNQGTVLSNDEDDISLSTLLKRQQNRRDMEPLEIGECSNSTMPDPPDATVSPKQQRKPSMLIVDEEAKTVTSIEPPMSSSPPSSPLSLSSLQPSSTSPRPSPDADASTTSDDITTILVLDSHHERIGESTTHVSSADDATFSVISSTTPLIVPAMSVDKLALQTVARDLDVFSAKSEKRETLARRQKATADKTKTRHKKVQQDKRSTDAPHYKSESTTTGSSGSNTTRRNSVHTNHDDTCNNDGAVLLKKYAATDERTTSEQKQQKYLHENRIDEATAFAISAALFDDDTTISANKQQQHTLPSMPSSSSSSSSLVLTPQSNSSSPRSFASGTSSSPRAMSSRSNSEPASVESKLSSAAVLRGYQQQQKKKVSLHAAAAAVGTSSSKSTRTNTASTSTRDHNGYCHDVRDDTDTVQAQAGGVPYGTCRCQKRKSPRQRRQQQKYPKDPKEKMVVVSYNDSELPSSARRYPQQKEIRQQQRQQQLDQMLDVQIAFLNSVPPPSTQYYNDAMDYHL